METVPVETPKCQLSAKPQVAQYKWIEAETLSEDLF
jgi:hypothetical protein